MKNEIEEIKKNVIPSKKEEKEKESIAKEVFELVLGTSKKYPEIVGIEYGGSYAKGTWLAKRADIDIFVKFKKSTRDDKFRNISRRIGFESMKKFKPYVRYSEHPYVEAEIKGTKVNVVPCYEVKLGEWKSAADRSPFHTKFMKKSLSNKMKEEVRILNSFLKFRGIYGAEIAKQGFSGYVSEVLILNFKTFENTIKSISKIKENQVIGKTNKEFETPIVIIDPIDSNRNLAAAISEENIGKFILMSRGFLNNPTEAYFKKGKLRKNLKNWDNVITVKFNYKKRSPDIIWGQIKRATTSISKQMNLGGFRVLRSWAYTDEKDTAFMFFFLESLDISKIFSKIGPSFFSEKDSERFISKNLRKADLLWINEDGRIQTIQKREIDKAKPFVEKLLKDLKKSGIPAGLHSDFRKGFKVFVGYKKLSKSIKREVTDFVSTDASIFYSN